MQRVIVKFLLEIGRVVSLVLLAVLGTIALVRFSPGYFVDAREMDSLHATEARAELAQREVQEATFSAAAAAVLSKWKIGDLGTSRQYQVPVSQLLRQRVIVSAQLITKALLLGWFFSFAMALPLSSRKSRNGESLIGLVSAALLCVPVALLATFCLVSNIGGATLVLSAVIAIRDFKLVYRMLCAAVRSSPFLYARTQGFSFVHAVKVHLFRALWAEFVALLTASLVVALSAVVPVEVIFDQPGLGQLAWSAAMNRDLPTLLAVTVLMASLIGFANVLSESEAQRGASACA